MDVPITVSAAELQKHRGKWVAFSADGAQIVASGLTLTEVEDRLAALGQDPEKVLLDRIEDEDLALNLRN